MCSFEISESFPFLSKNELFFNPRRKYNHRNRVNARWNRSLNGIPENIRN